MNRINRTKSGFTLIELLVVLAIVAILFTMVFGSIVKGISTSDGKRIGILTKFSYKGLIYKSYEGELNMGGVRNTRDSDGNVSVVANVWQFSCSNPTVAHQLDELVGKQVVIHYHQSFAGFSRDTSYDAVSVEEVKPEPKR